MPRRRAALRRGGARGAPVKQSFARPRITLRQRLSLRLCNMLQPPRDADAHLSTPIGKPSCRGIGFCASLVSKAPVPLVRAAERNAQRHTHTSVAAPPPSCTEGTAPGLVPISAGLEGTLNAPILGLPRHSLRRTYTTHA